MSLESVFSRANSIRPNQLDHHHYISKGCD